MSSSPDIIKDASDALRPISDRGITVMQGWYDKDIHDRHVTLWDLGENDENFSDECRGSDAVSAGHYIFRK